ncbi:MAG: helix-turn-helix transcriptional regulator [Firmicutes bacterium]|jgi:transcriptional regulator with XRE-family HTH domain|nr:helix-turn-helix transcriptional regulator [Bacillota bacterium]NBI64953.1 XRE family transcriptional regulator [Clostridiales bacterium]
MKILMNKKFASNLVLLRGESGLSQSELIRETGLLGSTLARSTYSKIELGIGNIKVSDLVALKEIYDVNYDRFFEGISVIETENL